MLAKVKVMLEIAVVASCFSFVHPTGAESKSLHQETPQAAMKNFNDFQYFVYTKPDADSALSCVRQLASDYKYASSLRNLLDNSFAQQFIPSDLIATGATRQTNRRLLSEEILSGMMSDTTELLLETARPIYLLSEIEDAENRPTKQKTLTEEFINTELSPSLFYTDKTGRFGLMIYRIISKQSALKPLAEKLFGLIYSTLRNNQISLTEPSSTSASNERAWYRYLYAYANYVKAEAADNVNVRENFLRIASDFSPDLIDRAHQIAYFYDMFFLLGKNKGSFRDDYIKLLMNSHTDAPQILSALSRAALADPAHKKELKTFYVSHGGSAKKFHNYWIDLVDSQAKIGRPIVLNELGGKRFSSKHLLGKWILVDFWGTWCEPCRKELPRLQRFYDSTVVRKSEYISLLTIACKCSYDDVSKFMKDKDYTFPVAMSDTAVEDVYSVQAYPTKILITPEGRYIEIPFGIDWIAFIKQYADL